MLECKVNNSLRITVSEVAQEESKKERKTFSVDLWDKTTSKKPLARKIVPWSTGQPLPIEVSYNKVTEEIEVSGPTTVALIPFPSAKIESLTATSVAKESNEGIKIYEGFAVNPVEAIDLSQLHTLTTAVYEHPTRSKKWSALVTYLTENAQLGETQGSLGSFEQSRLIEALVKYLESVDVDKSELERIFESILQAEILAFRSKDTLLQLAISKGLLSVVQNVLTDSSKALSEQVLAEILKIVAEKEESERQEGLLRVLKRSYTKSSLTESVANKLTPSEAIRLIMTLIDIYKKPDLDENNGKESKTLALITVLMDAHGTNFVLEDSLHKNIAEISQFVVDMSATIGTFISFGAKFTDEADPEEQLFSVRVVPTISEDLNW